MFEPEIMDFHGSPVTLRSFEDGLQDNPPFFSARKVLLEVIFQPAMFKYRRVPSDLN